MKYGKPDANQPEIVKLLHQIPGVSVQISTVLGGGFPDLIVAYNRETFLFEIKVPGGKLNALQEVFHKEWNGIVYTVESIEQILDILGIKYV